jgi:hypothetical protein
VDDAEPDEKSIEPFRNEYVYQIAHILFVSKRPKLLSESERRDAYGGGAHGLRASVLPEGAKTQITAQSR